MNELPFEETKSLINLVLNHSVKVAREELHRALARLKSNEGQFYDGIAKHRPGLRFTTEQWFELLSKLPNRMLRSQLDLERILSEEQIKRLPPVTG